MKEVLVKFCELSVITTHRLSLYLDDLFLREFV